jgi:sensor c-di-GMP phosphodiesterase-like protein
VNGRGSFARKRWQWLLALLSIGFVAWLAVYWSAVLDASDARQLLARSNIENVQVLEDVLDEFAVLAREIESRAGTACSPERLEHFRRYLFTLKHLRDVGIVRDRHLLCSTALGPIENPVRSSAPDLVLPGGLEIYAYRPVRVSARQPTMVIQTEGINALVDPGLIASLSRRFPIARSWILARDASEEFELFDHPAPIRNLPRDHSCSETHGFCLVAAAGTGFTSKPLRMAGLAVLGGGTGLAAFLFAQMLILRARSPRVRLRRAIRNGELRASYQPIVLVPETRRQGFELLARWPIAPQGLEGPEQFIAEAESQGLIHDLTETMIRTASIELGDILLDRPELRLAINISAFELEDNRLERVLRENFIARGIAPDQIVIELTERSVASPHRERINRLAAQGFRIYIDDLGEGYSSLSYLHDLRLSGVKISRSFTSGLGTDSPKAELVKAMVELARKLKLDVVLEGIEAESGHAAVLELGSIACQGFYYARPMDIEQLKGWMAGGDLPSAMPGLPA